LSTSSFKDLRKLHEHENMISNMFNAF
ncbi:hypothetical protein LCGC14_1324960, partial [marine sediment metagenome]